MKTLVTGATGMIGFNIVRQLLEQGRDVRAIVRSPEAARSVLPAKCEIVPGDVTDAESLRKAVTDCDTVFHAAGLPEQWLKNSETFQAVNVRGTENVLVAARNAEVKKFLYTSTIDVFAAKSGETYDESIIDSEPKGTAYERSKQDADRLAVQYQKDGLPVVFLHPSGLYGPGPAKSPGINDLIVDLKRGKVPVLLPGGFPLVFSEDVARGHLLAERQAQPGDRFILSDVYLDLSEIAALIGRELGLAKIPGVMPLWVGQSISTAGEALSRLTGKPPLLPKGQLHFMQWKAIPDHSRATQQLGWTPVPFELGLKRTIDFLKATGRI